MSWKNFLRPSWKKFSFFLIFALVYTILIISLLSDYATDISNAIKIIDNGEFATAVRGTIKVYLEHSLPAYQIYAIPLTAGLSYVYPQGNLILAYAIIGLYWYLLSCLIVWALSFRRQVQR
jgi:hypothetical protein